MSYKDPLPPSSTSTAVPLGTLPRGASLGDASKDPSLQDRAWLRRGSNASSLTRDASDASPAAARSTTDDAVRDTDAGGLARITLM